MTLPVKVVDMLVAGALLMAGLGSFIGVENYQPPSLGSVTYVVTWTSNGLNIPAQAEEVPTATSQGGVANLTLAMTQPNVTVARVEVTVFSSSGQPRLLDTHYKIEVRIPNVPAAYPKEIVIRPGQDEASATVDIPNQAATPQVKEVTRTNYTEAVKAIMAYENREKVGDWHVNVTYDADQNQASGINNGFDIQVRITGNYYIGTLHPKTRQG